MSDPEHPSRAVSIPLVDADYSSSTLLQDEMMAAMIADGTTMVDVCAALGINRRQVYLRLTKDAPFAKLLDEARALGFEVLAEYTRKVASGVEGYSSGDWKRDKLIIDTDLKLLSKWHPERYGDKIEIKSRNMNANTAISDDPVEAARQYAEMMGART